MAVEFAGQQPAVAMKQGNTCQAKGHSQTTKTNYLTFLGSCETNLIRNKTRKDDVQMAIRLEYHVPNVEKG
jgi:hypothetical protein